MFNHPSLSISIFLKSYMGGGGQRGLEYHTPHYSALHTSGSGICVTIYCLSEGIECFLRGFASSFVKDSTDNAEGYVKKDDDPFV